MAIFPGKCARIANTKLTKTVPHIPSIAGEALRESVEHVRTIGVIELFLQANQWPLYNNVAADILRMRQEVQKINKPFGQLSEEELMLVYRLVWRLVDLYYLEIKLGVLHFRKNITINEKRREYIAWIRYIFRRAKIGSRNPYLG